jgi:hypothetical protein
LDKHGCGPREIKIEEQADPSHDLAIARGHDLVYCRRCAGRSSPEGGPLRKLSLQCTGMRPGNRGTLRLLELGIRPLPGAFIPLQWRKIHWGGRNGVRSSGGRRRSSVPRHPNGSKGILENRF